MEFIWQDSFYVLEKPFGGKVIGLQRHGQRPLNCVIRIEELDTPLNMPLSKYMYHVKKALRENGIIILT